MFNAIALGNEYRKNKYGNSFGWVPLDLDKLKQLDNSRTPSLCTMEPRDVSMYKARFSYWDEWTGSRYVRKENSFINMSANAWKDKYNKNKPVITLGTVCRNNPITGSWEAI